MPVATWSTCLLGECSGGVFSPTSNDHLSLCSHYEVWHWACKTNTHTHFLVVRVILNKLAQQPRMGSNGLIQSIDPRAVYLGYWQTGVHPPEKAKHLQTNLAVRSTQKKSKITPLTFLAPQNCKKHANSKPYTPTFRCVNTSQFLFHEPQAQCFQHFEHPFLLSLTPRITSLSTVLFC